MGALTSSIGKAVKSIQRVSASIPSGATSHPVTITAVDVAKSYVEPAGMRSTTTAAPEFNCTLDLTNSTTVTIQRATASGGTVVNFQVVEFY
jgi:hypothetical protein